MLYTTTIVELSACYCRLSRSSYKYNIHSNLPVLLFIILLSVAHQNIQVKDDLRMRYNEPKPKKQVALHRLLAPVRIGFNIGFAPRLGI